MEKTIKYAAFLGVLVLTGCGGGGSGGSVEDDSRNLPESRPVATVSGTAFDGLIIDGDVRVYDFTGANKGQLLGSGRTNGQGLYSVSLSTSDKPVLIEVDGGYYLEEASGVQVQVDKSKGLKMLAVEYYESGKPIDVSATFFTNIATGYFQYLVKNHGFSEEVAVERAYAAVDAWAGFDTRRTHPVDVRDFANATPYMTDSHRYGFVAAGVSTTSLEVGNESGAGVHDFYTSIAFNQLAYQDVVNDGLLDGIGSTGRLSFGNRSINSNTYRDKLSLSMLRFAASDNNATGMGFDDLLPFATKINQDAGDLFGGVVAPDITAIEPVITQFVPASGVTMSGTYPVSVLVTDPTGIESIHFYVGERYVTAASPRNGLGSIDTLNFVNGPYVLRVVVTNFMGNSVSMERNVIINNGTLALAGPGSYTFWETVGNGDPKAACNYSLLLVDTTGLGVDYAKVGNDIKLFDDPIASGQATISGSTGGMSWNVTKEDRLCRNFTLAAKDRLGNEYSFPFRVTKKFLDAELISFDKGFKMKFECRYEPNVTC